MITHLQLFTNFMTYQWKLTIVLFLPASRKMEITLSCEEIEKTRKILESRRFLNDNCLEIALTTLDNKRTRKKYLLINQTGRQVPFTKKPDYIDVNRVTKSLRKYMQSKFCSSQKAIVLVYNRPKEYYPKLDEALQEAVRPHWYVLVIVFDSSFNFKIKVIDSFYKINQNMKKNILIEAKLYITTLIQIFLELQGHDTRNIELNKECLQIIPSIKQTDDYSCGDFSIEAIKSILKHMIWGKNCNNASQKRLKKLKINNTRTQLMEILDTFSENASKLQKLKRHDKKKVQMKNASHKSSHHLFIKKIIDRRRQKQKLSKNCKIAPKLQ